MRKVALALVLIGLMVATGFATMSGADTADAEEIISAEEPPTRNDAHNKLTPLPTMVWVGPRELQSALEPEMA